MVAPVACIALEEVELGAEAEPVAVGSGGGLVLMTVFVGVVRGVWRYQMSWFCLCYIWDEWLRLALRLLYSRPNGGRASVLAVGLWSCHVLRALLGK